MKNLLVVIFFFVIAISISTVWAQSVPEGCSKEYDQINEVCIRKFGEKIKGQKSKLIIPIGEKSNQLIENTYFYATSDGHLGKMNITAINKTATSCIAYLRATTYIQGKSHVPQISLFAKNEFGNWVGDSVALTKNGSGEFRLDVRSRFKALNAQQESKLSKAEKEVYTREKEKHKSLQANKIETGTCYLSLEGAKGVFYMNTKAESLTTGKELIYYAALFLIGLAVFLVARAVFRDEERFKASEKLEDAENEGGDKKGPPVNDFVLKYSRPFFKRYFSPIVNGMKNKKKFRDKYRRKLATAGLTKELTPEDFFAFKLFLIIGFPIVFLAVRTFLEETWPLSLTPVMSVVGFFYPDIWINGRIQKRKEEIIQSMPFVVDMLALSVEAGLDFMAAMVKVIEKSKANALTEEFEIMIKETKIGASRAEGLRQLSWRTDTIQIASFSATLIAADSVGASIGPILKTLAAEMRQKRSADAEKKGATAATKILFPMMFLIMPSVAIIIMAPMMLQFLAG